MKTEIMKIIISAQLLCFIIVFSFSSSILQKKWDFETDKGTIHDYEFVIKDTLSVAIHFQGEIPPDFLPGHCNFSISISDTAVMSKDGYITTFQIDFDAGFLYYDHTLILKINYKSGIIPSSMTKPENFTVFRDPFPVTKMHQWFNLGQKNDSMILDTVNSLIGFFYNHPKYIASPQTRIASTGYPFIYGLFYMTIVFNEWKIDYGMF